MRRKIIDMVLFMVCVMLLIGCSKTKPQAPSNYRGARQDSTSVAFVLLNQQLAQEADAAVLSYVKDHQSEEYSQAQSGYWIRKITKNDNDTTHIKNGEELDLRIAMWKLTDEKKLILDNRELFKVSEAGMPLPIYETLLEMKRQEKVELIVPWYAAYGSTGNSYVQPYTNLIIELECY